MFDYYRLGRPLKWPDPQLPSQQPVFGPPRKISALILGDSLTKYLRENFDSCLLSPDVHTRRGATVQILRQYVINNAHQLHTADVIFLHVGTNNLEQGFLHSNIQAYRRLLTTVRENFPLTEIVVSGILPRSDDSRLNLSRVMHNIKLANICHNFSHCKFLDFSDMFHECHLAKDGLHLNWDGNYLFSRLIQKQLEKMSKPIDPRGTPQPHCPHELKKLVRTPRKKISAKCPKTKRCIDIPKPPTSSSTTSKTSDTTKPPPSVTTKPPKMSRKQRKSRQVIEDREGFLQLGRSLSSTKPVMYFIKPYVAMATIRYEEVNSNFHHSRGASHQQVRLPKAETPYVASRKQGKRRRKRKKQIVKRRRRRKWKVSL